MAGTDEPTPADAYLALAQALLAAESPPAVAEAVAYALAPAAGAARAELVLASDGLYPMTPAVAGAEAWLGTPAALRASGANWAEGALARGAAAGAALQIGGPAASGRSRRSHRATALVLEFAAPQAFDQAQRDRVRALAGQVALAVHRAELLDGEQAVIRFSDEQIGVFAHDVRSPLGAIALTAETLLGTSADPSARRRFELIQRGTKRMERMVNELVDFVRARLGSGLSCRPTDADLATLARTAVDDTGSRTGRDIQVSATGDGRGAWDPDRLGQAVAHLVGNAAEHGDPAAPVRVDVDGGAPDRVRLRVWNAGTIEPDVIPRVFAPFRGGRPRTKSSGLGLGLHLAEAIAHAHHGSIRVESTAAAGTTFTLDLPRRP